jgi:hypothetical protein
MSKHSDANDVFSLSYRLGITWAVTFRSFFVFNFSNRISQSA